MVEYREIIMKDYILMNVMILKIDILYNIILLY